VQKISPAPGFDPRTVQPVASRYTDYAIPAPLFMGIFLFTPPFSGTQLGRKKGYIPVLLKIVRRELLIRQHQE
jgi:hypothetical protein